MSLIETATTLKVDRQVALDALRSYRQARAPRTKEDQAIMAAYRAIARGKAVISVDQSIREAGWNDNGTSKLAFTRANVRRCAGWFGSNRAFFYADTRSNSYQARYTIEEMPDCPNKYGGRSTAIVPLIPLPLRPKFSLRNYWILWEAEWTARPPRDPLLLRKLSGDLWLVLAAWELTAVEQAVLARRV